MHELRAVPQWWSELSAGFLKSVARRGRRPNTQRAYGFELVDLGTWLERAGVAAMGDFTRAHIEAWQDDLQTRKAPHTQQVAAAAVRGALRWAADQDMPLSSPALWLRVVRRRAPRLEPKPIPRHDLEQIRAFLEQATPALLELRTRALFSIIFSSGARISEALSLTRYSVVDGTAAVIQKGGSEHHLMISDKAVAAMQDYLEARSDRTPALWISHEGPRPLGPLGKQEAQRGWDHLCAEVGVPRFTSHQIRHSCATEMLRLGINPLVIAKHLGHHGLGSIEGYAEVGRDTRRQAMDALDRTA